MSRSRIAIVAAAGVLAAVAFAPGIAVAGPHFISATGGIDAKTGDYIASFKEAGLGNTPITYNLSATTQYTFQCFTKSGNKPQGSPNSGGPSNESTQTTLTPRNGQITASLIIDVTFPPTSVACQGGGLKLCLTAASYTNVSLADTTDGIAVGLPDAATAAPSGGFIACSD
jgi:hypothetical protein